jgi:hypothetical protein
MNNLTVALIAVIAVLGGFYGGFRYEAGKVTTASAAAATPTPRTGGAGGGGFGGAGSGGGAGGGAGFAGGRGNAGTVTNLTSTGFTLHSANGTDTKVTFAPTITVRKSVAGQVSDVSMNATVQVAGTRDSSGNLVAMTITLVPLPTASPSAGG